MGATSTHEERIQQLPVGLKTLWAGVLLAPGAWVVCEAVGYVLASRLCERGASAAGVSGAGGASIIGPMLVGIITFLVAVSGLVISLRNWRALHPEPTRDDSVEWGRAHFLAFTGVLASTLFAGGIALFAIAPLLLDSCSQVR